MFDFFLSYNKAEKDWTRQLAKALRERGAKVFFDEDTIKIGEGVPSAISAALQSSRHVVLVLSPRSVGSKWVELEWASSLYSDPSATDRRLLPLLIEDCDVPFLLQHLRYLDACGKSVDECAELLVASVDFLPQKEDIEPPPVRITTTRALGIWDHYLERAADRLVSRAINSGRGAYIFGPRRIGKTSLLRRQIYAADIRGTPTVLLNLSMSRPGEIEKTFHEEILRSLNPRRLFYSLRHKDGSLKHLARECLIESAASSSTKEILLLIDEMDSIWAGENEANAFADILRDMLSHPGFDCVRWVVAGYSPPWAWQESRPVSPWWNNFALIPMAYFEETQVVEFFSMLAVDEPEAKALFEYTGGNPSQTMEAAYAVKNGDNLRELLSDPLRMAGPFMSWFGWASRSTQSLLQSQASLIHALCHGQSVVERNDRLKLWLHGLTRDPDANPPEILGRQVLALFHELGLTGNS